MLRCYAQLNCESVKSRDLLSMRERNANLFAYQSTGRETSHLYASFSKAFTCFRLLDETYEVIDSVIVCTWEVEIYSPK